MSKQYKLSLCLITNNDEDYIRDCLVRFRDIADEIIIADIGSADHTVAIARQEGAQVYSVDWHEDFSEVKNNLMEHALGNWVLFMQPNETISENQIALIPSLLDNPNAEGYLMLIDYRSESYRISSPIQALRLLRNHPENRYRYCSFECIPDEFMTGVVNSDVEIKQQYDAMLSWELNLRMTLLQKELISWPQDCYLQYMLGLLKLNQENLEECIAYFQKATLGINTGYLFAPHLWKCLSWAYLFLEQYDDAMDVLSEGIELYPFYTDLLILRAEVNRQLNQYENAIADMEQCMKLRGCPNPSVPMPEISDAYALTLLGEIYEHVLDNSKALSYYIQAYQLDSTDTELLIKIEELIETVGSEETADNLICIALEQQDRDILLSLLIMLQRKHAFAAILSHMQSIVQILGNEQAEYFETSCRLLINDSSIQTDEYGLDMIFRQIEICWMHDRWSIAENLLGQLKRYGLLEKASIDLYINVHRILTREGPGRISLEPQLYDMAKSIHDDFLWKGQSDKAILLLPMLLDNQTDERCLQLAIPWTRIGDVNAIRLVYSILECDEAKKDFIQKVVTELLRCDYPCEAEEIKKFKRVPLPEELERALRSSCIIHKLEEQLKELEISKSIPRSEIHTKLPGKDLVQYYHLLCGLDGSTPKEVLTSAQTHEAIGDLYIKSNKISEAFSAYLTVLQMDTWNFEVQRKVIHIITEDPTLEGLLKKFDRFSPYGCFTEPNSYANFILALKEYYNGSFQQATTLFSQTISNPKTSLICTSYASSIPLLEACLDELGQVNRFEISLDYYEVRACLNFILYYIQKPFLYCSDLLILLEEKTFKLITSFYHGYIPGGY